MISKEMSKESSKKAVRKAIKLVGLKQHICGKPFSVQHVISRVVGHELKLSCVPSLRPKFFF